MQSTPKFRTGAIATALTVECNPLQNSEPEPIATALIVECNPLQTIMFTGIHALSRRHRSGSLATCCRPLRRLRSQIRCVHSTVITTSATAINNTTSFCQEASDTLLQRWQTNPNGFIPPLHTEQRRLRCFRCSLLTDPCTALWLFW